MLTYLDIQTRVLRLMDEAASSSVQTNTENLIKDAINASHRRLCLSRAWAFMRWPREETFSTVSGTRTVVLNQNVGKILHVWDTGSRMFLPMIPLRQWEVLGIDRGATAGTRGAIFGGFWPVSAQPTAATAVTIVSTSASDTAVTVSLRGIDANGDIATETLTATGTTPVIGSVTFLYLLNVTKVGTWVGTMTAKFGSTTVLTLTATQYGKQYPTLEFVETPSSAETFTYTFSRIPTTLTSDHDIPEIPFPYSEMLVYDALLDLVTYRTDVNANHVQLWMTRKEALVKQLDEAQDEAIVGSVVRTVRDVEGARTRAIFA